MNKEERIQKFLYRVRFEDLSSEYLKGLVEMARAEDLEGAGLANRPKNTGDPSSLLLAQKGSGEATLCAREGLVLCGLPIVHFVLDSYHPELAFHTTQMDGTAVDSGDILGTVSGPIRELLMAERVLLNFLQFLSGIATETKHYVDALENSTTRLLDTRKTTPGYRMLQKYAVACGGGWNHRLGLFDRVMLKDNHLAAHKSDSGQALSELVRRANKENPDILIEVEVDSLIQIPPILEASPDKLMLDNFSIPDLRQAVEMIGDKACTEATGGITIDNLEELGGLGLDFISTGALVHKAVWKDIGLDWSS